MPVLSVNSLNSGYGKHQILFDVNYDANNGITAIIGSNGSGKSTLLKSICGACNVYSGRILLHGKDITNLSTYKIMQNIAYMPQTNNVFSELSITENLIIANIPDKPNWGFIYELFPMLKDKSNLNAKNLSGGQRQLLAMAMCISKSPPVILFDEPTASLSPQSAKMVLDKITQIQHKLQNCIIIVEQNVKSALDICDRCCLFASGKKIFDGTSKELLSYESFESKFLGIKK